jgi:hypothetical protein
VGAGEDSRPNVFVTNVTPWISYEWPADGVDPFDRASPEPLWRVTWLVSRRIAIENWH